MTEFLFPGTGDRICLIEMPNDPCPIEPGSLGTVTYVSSGPQHDEHDAAQYAMTVSA